MTTYTQTPNFRVKIPNRDKRFWHEEYKQGMTTFDAVLAKYIAVNQFQGVWENSTAYVLGDTVLDENDGALYQCSVSHTSAASGTFAAARTANPTYWTDVSFLVRFRGTWMNSTVYNRGDFVVSGHIYALCTVGHTSTGTGTIDDVNNTGNWSFLIDATDTVATINNQTFRPVQVVSGAKTIANLDKNNLLVYNGTGHTWDIDGTSLDAAFECVIVNLGNGVLTLDPAGSQTIDQLATVTLAGHSSCILTRQSSSEFLTSALSFQSQPAGYVVAAPAAANGRVAARRLVGTDMPDAAISTQAGAYVILSTDRNSIIIQTAAGTISLPTGVSSGFQVTVLNKHTAAITVDTAGAELIAGAASVSLQPDASATFVFDGTAYQRLSGSGGGGGYAMAILFGA